MTQVTLTHQGMTRIDADRLAALVAAAAKSPTKRERFCLHESHADAIQEMVIAICRGSLVRPHRHPNRCESLHAIDGRAMVVTFDETGSVVDRITLAPLGRGDACMIRFAPQTWHTVVPLTDVVIIHEVAQGPFEPSSSEFAIWAPPAGEALARWLDDVAVVA